MDWLSLLLPIGYLGILVLSLGTFSRLYRRRKASAAASLAPWFPPHRPRQIYLSLLEDSENKEKGDEVIPSTVLKAALLRRAIEDVRRATILQKAKPALTQLLQRGGVGDELWQRFQIAEAELKNDVDDVRAEANALAAEQMWGATIFQTAGECVGHEQLQVKLREIESTRAQEKEDWEKRRESVAENFMKEIQGPTKDLPADTKDARKQGSGDEDGVIVEPDGPMSPMTPGTPGTPATPATGGGKKKKNKNRK
ncbi:MAG: translocation protein S66 [Chrysothrix sp. TS-e1954]|nr:MAG: translocation protein S66 [Chrysothrix sp. TS-e1954]